MNTITKKPRRTTNTVKIKIMICKNTTTWNNYSLLKYTTTIKFDTFTRIEINN